MNRKTEKNKNKYSDAFTSKTLQVISSTQVYLTHKINSGVTTFPKVA